MNHKEYKRQYYLKNKIIIDKQNKKWQKEHPDEKNAIHRKYRRSKKGKIQSAKERIKYKNQITARRLINNLLRYHNVREMCAICGSNRNVEVHHENYNEPFIIIWLCREHHLKGDINA